jgi:hypothetical protein
MEFSLFEAAGLFVLWLIQFMVPHVREEIIWVYAFWALIETLRMIKNFRQRNALNVFWELSRKLLKKEAY